jgi:isopentenyl-diphosphate Delta-isomerase
MTTPQELVVLVDTAGQEIGQSVKADVHGTSTPLHLAFSLYLFDEQGRVLMTRRALARPTWPGVWTNTCCGHPMPGERIRDTVARRLKLELGLEAPNITCVLPDSAHTATHSSGIVENELCSVYEARLVYPEPGVIPNRDEVMDWRQPRPCAYPARTAIDHCARPPVLSTLVDRSASPTRGLKPATRSTVDLLPLTSWRTCASSTALQVDPPRGPPGDESLQASPGFGETVAQVIVVRLARTCPGFRPPPICLPSHGGFTGL